MIGRKSAISTLVRGASRPQNWEKVFGIAASPIEHQHHSDLRTGRKYDDPFQFNTSTPRRLTYAAVIHRVSIESGGREGPNEKT
jgi:hypothetical protein